jgi:hypothetical protein
MNQSWEEIQYAKVDLKSVEDTLLDITMAERDASASKDVHLLEKARQAISEALVQIGLFEESRTGHVWRKI